MMEELFMFRMVKDETGGVLHYGVLRDGAGFKAVSGYGWNWRNYGDGDALLSSVAAEERHGYHLDYGPLSFRISDRNATGIREVLGGDLWNVLLDSFHDAGAPSV